MGDDGRPLPQGTRTGRNVRAALIDVRESERDQAPDGVLGPSARDYMLQLLDVAGFEMARADDKANTLFRFYGVVAALSVGILAGNSWSPKELTALSQAFFWAGCIVLAASGVCLGLILYPRKVRANDRDRLLFFGRVTAYRSSAELTNALLAVEDDTESRTVEQLLTISRLVEHKFALMRGALICLGAGTLLIAAALLANRVG